MSRRTEPIKTQSAASLNPRKPQRPKSNDPRTQQRRRLRIAKGSGRTVQEVNTLLSQFKQMQKFMKIAGKTGGAGLKLPFGRGGFPG